MLGLTRILTAGTGLVCLAVTLAAGCARAPRIAETPNRATSTNYPLDSPGARNGTMRSGHDRLTAYQKLRREQQLHEPSALATQSTMANSVEALLGTARLDQYSGEPHRIIEAERGYRRALALDPHSPEILDAVGQFYVEQKRYSEALQYLNEAANDAPGQPNYRFHLAIALTKSGKIGQALPEFEQVVGRAAAHYNVGLLLHEQGDLKGSEHHMELALQVNPELQAAQYWLAEIRTEREELLAEARREWEERTRTAARESRTPDEEIREAQWSGSQTDREASAGEARQVRATAPRSISYPRKRESQTRAHSRAADRRENDSGTSREEQPTETESEVQPAGATVQANLAGQVRVTDTRETRSTSDGSFQDGSAAASPL